MNKINKNLIIYALGILAIFTFVFFFITPKEVNAASWNASNAKNYNYSFDTPNFTYTNSYNSGNTDYTDTGHTTYPPSTDNPSTSNGATSNYLNPVPTISQISPSSTPMDTEALTITVTGSKFMVGSIGRVNGENRTTNYVYEKINGINRFKSTVLTMDLTKEDLYSGRPITITVFNPAPGGGTSNAVKFNDNEKDSSLAAGAIFGSDGFMPRTFVQWLMLIVLVVLLVILVRKAYRKKEKYEEVPLKHA
ncbi:hypothetical protein KKA39_02250 [Patescibacteria group bacterium]|nr:hypothetical protein [Patescibacteria group bacterium]MBU1728106.1 hypothetical protein [Patescibacteria group bacterium]